LDEIEKIQINKFSPISFSIALDSKGKVYSWGHNNNGQLGLNDTNSREFPNLIQNLRKKQVS